MMRKFILMTSSYIAVISLQTSKYSQNPAPEHRSVLRNTCLDHQSIPNICSRWWKWEAEDCGNDSSIELW